LHRIKVEILIPKFDNNNAKIDGRKHGATYREIFKQFNGCTQDKSPLLGSWIDPNTGKKYKDKNFSYWVICDDNYNTTYFLDNLKERLKERYEQEDILMYGTEIRML
jgi:hypothetical protein